MTEHPHNPTSKSAPVSVRLTPEERAWLCRAAGVASLSDFIRARLFADGVDAAASLAERQADEALALSDRHRRAKPKQTFENSPRHRHERHYRASGFVHERKAYELPSNFDSRFANCFESNRHRSRPAHPRTSV